MLKSVYHLNLAILQKPQVHRIIESPEASQSSHAQDGLQQSAQFSQWNSVRKEPRAPRAPRASAYQMRKYRFETFPRMKWMCQGIDTTVGCQFNALNCFCIPSIQTNQNRLSQDDRNSTPEAATRWDTGWMQQPKQILNMKVLPWLQHNFRHPVIVSSLVPCLVGAFCPQVASFACLNAQILLLVFKASRSFASAFADMSILSFEERLLP